MNVLNSVKAFDHVLSKTKRLSFLVCSEIATLVCSMHLDVFLFN